MPDVELEVFFRDNAKLYSAASAEDLEQLRKISLLYPDRVKLLRDDDAVEIEGFNCLRCGSCCSTVKFIPVCHSDVLRWLEQKRWDVFNRLAVDRRRTPLMAIWGREAVAAARQHAMDQLEQHEVPEEHRPRVMEILYVTDLVESVVYTAREAGCCIFFDENGATCAIHDTKPKVCEKFPFYVGKYTDPGLLKRNFCPAIKALARKETPKT